MATDPEEAAGQERFESVSNDAQPTAKHDLDMRQPLAEEGSIFLIDGDPDQFDDVLSGEVVDPDAVGDLDVGPGFLRVLLANPDKAPELLAKRAVEHDADRAVRDVKLLRERNPQATDRQLAVYFKQKYSRAARWEGAGTGSAGLLGLPVDLVMLAKIQSRLVLTIAAVYGHDMSDHSERAADLLVIQGVHNSREVARKALVSASAKTLKKLIVRHLRKDALLLVKRLFRVVGIKFTRKALLEKGVPLVAIPISAGVNDVSTRLVGNQAIKFYDTMIA
jgi:hypothetical protein